MPVAPAAKVNPALLALKPRQVLLGSSSAMKNKGGKNSNGHKASPGKQLSLNVDQKILLHQSIASYLERCGFSKTLKKFRLEAQIQKDDLENSMVALEEMCLRHLKMGEDTDTILNNQIDQDGKRDLATTVDNVNNKSKKKCNESGINAKFSKSGAAEKIETSVHAKENICNGVTESNINAGEEKEKPKKKKFNALGEEEAQKNFSGDVEDESLKQDPDKKSKKKKKNKSDADAFEHSQPEVPPANQTASSHKSEKDSKEKKKKKLKSKSDPIVGGETESQENSIEKVEKKKKKEGISESNLKEDSEELQVDSDGDKPLTNHSKTSNDDATAKEKKKSKKRKRPTSDNEPSEVDEKKNKKPEKGKVENFKESSANEQSGKVTAADEQANKNFEKTGGKNSSQRPTKKQHSGSEEPKTAKVFQRLKVDHIAYADERLQDNSYWAMDGADSGYGAKAQEILGQVRGRDFRHEKTKKKRGTYRGGKIDLDSHSVKFNYSDDE